MLKRRARGRNSLSSHHNVSSYETDIGHESLPKTCRFSWSPPSFIF